VREPATPGVFTPAFREEIRSCVLEMAGADERIVAAAEVGSQALGDGDRWSDLDLTFGVAEGIAITDVLEGWTNSLAAQFSAVRLFDLPYGTTIYRVFLFPGCLQVDLSFSPGSNFGALGPKFKLLFGEAFERPFPPPPRARDLFGYAVHHALRARFSIARGRLWQAEYWLAEARNYSLNLACLARQLPARDARGYDQLPAEVLARFEPSFARSLEAGELLRALAVAVSCLLKEAGAARELARKVDHELRKLTGAWDS